MPSVAEVCTSFVPNFNPNMTPKAIPMAMRQPHDARHIVLVRLLTVMVAILDMRGGNRSATREQERVFM